MTRNKKGPRNAGLFVEPERSASDGAVSRELAGAFDQHRDAATEQRQGELITVVGHEQTVS